jgi:hypothetical protein
VARGGKVKAAGKATPGESRWAVSLGLAALATLAVCWPAWPGFMSYDSLLAYSQAVHGVETMNWPPLHTYLFALSRRLGAGAGGLFVFQTFVLLAAANLILSLAVRKTWLAVGLMLLFLASFLWVTPQLGVLMAQWRDVTTTSFALAGVALWLLGVRSRAVAWLVAAAAAFGCAAALRYNTLPLIAFVLGLMVWRPLLGAQISRPGRLLVIGSVVASLALAWASTQWRLPDFKRMPTGHNAMITEQFDLIGTSACAGQDLLPVGMTGGAPIPAAPIRAGYDARHLNLSLRGAHLAKLAPTDANSALTAAAWRRAILSHPVCYLRHRAAVFREQMGLARDHLFYPTHGAIDPNPFGLKLAHPALAARTTAFVSSGALPMGRRAVWLYALALPLALVAGWRRRDQAPLLLALMAGAFAFVGLLFLAGPAADARYIFPSNSVCALVIALSLAALLPRRLVG